MLLILGGAFAGLIALIVIISVATSGSKPAVSNSAPPPAATSAPAATTAPAPTVTQTVTQTVTASAAAAPVAAAPAAPPADTVIAKFYGNGSGNTGSFTVPADGNWHLSYAYTNGSLFAGEAENFQVYEYGTDGTLNNILVNALGIGNGQPTADPVYSDSLAGSRAYFQVNTEDASWELVVLTGTS